MAATLASRTESQTGRFPVARPARVAMIVISVP